MSFAEAKRQDDGALYRAALLLLLALAAVIGFVAALDWALRPDNFPVRNVRFEGAFQRVSHTELAAAVGEAVRGNFLLVDLQQVKAQVETLPWVHRAAVRRWWPSDVYVQFEEQRIVARWGERAWVNHVGEAVRLPAAGLPADMPTLNGPEGTAAQVLEQYQQLAPILGAHGLVLQRLELSPRRTWVLQLTNGIELVVDRLEPARKVERFARLYTQTLAAEETRVRRVDLRYANGFAVQWRPGTGANKEG